MKVEKTCAEVDKSSNLCMLTSLGSKDCVFQIEPRYQYRIWGQRISYGDVLTFSATKAAKGNKMSLHVSDNKLLRNSDKYQDPGFKEAHTRI
jgi:hypothetical protein